MVQNDLLIQVKALKTYFYLDEGVVRAVDGAEFAIHRGETLAVVGESGCGKSVTAQSILRIVPPPGRIVEGELLYHRYAGANGASSAAEVIDLAGLDPRGREIRAIRGNEIAMVFQEPMISLSPVHTIGNQIIESIRLHQGASRAEAREGAADILARVGMPKPSQTLDSYPFELSGGMRQRAMIAMALSCHPSLLIADEPTTALDVTTQAQILDLLREMQEQIGMAIMLITHDLGVVAEMADDVAVMYLGRVAEHAPVDAIFHDARHPYTQALLRSIPTVGSEARERLSSIRGMVPDPFNRPSGCVFHPRCDAAQAGLCDVETPVTVEVAPNHEVTCCACRG